MTLSPAVPSPLAGTVLSAQRSLDDEISALTRVRERVRDHQLVAVQAAGGHSWRGDAERRFVAGAAELATTLARARYALESAIDLAAHASASLAATAAILGADERAGLDDGR